MNGGGKPIVFLGRGYEPVLPTIVNMPDIEIGQIKRKPFPDGEQGVQIATKVAGRDVILVVGITPDTNMITDVLGLIDTLGRIGALGVALVVPYLGYSTQERAVEPGEVVSAKTVMRYMSLAMGSSHKRRIFLNSLHAMQIEHYAEAGARTAHFSPDALIDREIRRLGGDNFVVCSTDAGRAKEVTKIAQRLNVQPGFVYKSRKSGTETDVVAVNFDVNGKNVVFYDDMTRTGGSLRGAAKAVLQHGAKKVSACTVHSVFPGNSATQMAECGLFTEFVCFDSHPVAATLKAPFFKVVPVVCPMIEYAIENP